jgi:hypothetical protein
MERRVFIQTAAKALAVVPSFNPNAKAEPSTSVEAENGSKGGSTMSNYTHNTVPTEFVEANGIRFAYRRFGKKSGVPLVFNMHLNGNLDMWDPAVTDGLAKEREVILFDNAGVGSSTGEVPNTFADMAKNAIAFIQARLQVTSFSSASHRAPRTATRATTRRWGQPRWRQSWSGASRLESASPT